jgi:hypothetical protein
MIIGPPLIGYPYGGCVLDALQGGLPTAAYSLRRLTASYKGKCINVRRSSDNTAMDIGFVGNVLDTTTLLNFCSGGSGYAAKWYNQGTLGSLADGIQGTASTQPQIVANGVLQTFSGKPSLYGTGQLRFQTPSVTTFAGNVWTLNAVYKGLNANGACISQAASQDYFILIGSGGSSAPGTFVQTYVFGASNSGAGSATTNIGNVATSVFSSSGPASGSLATFVDGSLSKTTSTTFTQVSGGPAGLQIGSSNIYGFYWPGYMSETMVFGYTMGTADLATLHNDQLAFY